MSEPSLMLSRVNNHANDLSDYPSLTFWSTRLDEVQLCSFEVKVSVGPY